MTNKIKKQRFKKIIKHIPDISFIEWFREVWGMREEDGIDIVTIYPILNLVLALCLNISFFPLLIYWWFKRKKEEYYEEL